MAMSGRKGELESSLLWIFFYQVLITLSYETGQGSLLRRNQSDANSLWLLSTTPLLWCKC